jgi:hypothetical protein
MLGPGPQQGQRHEVFAQYRLGTVVQWATARLHEALARAVSTYELVIRCRRDIAKSEHHSVSLVATLTLGRQSAATPPKNHECRWPLFSERLTVFKVRELLWSHWVRVNTILLEARRKNFHLRWARKKVDRGEIVG